MLRLFVVVSAAPVSPIQRVTFVQVIVHTPAPPPKVAMISRTLPDAGGVVKIGVYVAALAPLL